MSASVVAVPGRTVATFGDFNRSWAELTRTPSRQHLVRHLVECGTRPVLEALLAVAGGDELDAVLEDFARLRPETCRAIGANVLPIDSVTIVRGGRT
jgi:hypothetical protein